MINKLSSEYLYFVFSRMIALLVKPAFLWFLLRIEYSTAANTISLFYLVLSSVMVVLNNEAHFDFYKSLFEVKNKNLRNLVLQKEYYYERLVHHIIIFSILTFIFTYLLSNDLYYAICFFLILITEKFFDEIQRVLQFKKEFKTWSNLFIIKSMIPFLLSLFSFFIIKSETILILTYLFFSFVVTFLIVIYKTPSKDKELFLKIIKNVSFKGLINYLKIYKDKLSINQLQSFSTRNVPLTDRLIVRFFMPDFLAQMSIISQLGSICILFIDYFLIAHRRKEYLIIKKNVFDIISIKKLTFFFFASLFSYFAIVLIGTYYKLFQEIDLSSTLLLIIGVYYSIFAISQHFVQYNFWNIKRKFTLSVDLFFYVIVFGIFIILTTVTNFYYSLSITLLIGHSARLVMSSIISLGKR